MNELTNRNTSLNSVTDKKGFEGGIDQGDLIIPRAQLLQAMSPILSLPEYAGTFKPGMIINNLTKDVLPPTFVPVFTFTNWIRFNPRNSKDPNYDHAYEPGSVIYRTNDPYDARLKHDAQFGENGEPPLAIKFLNFFSYFPGQSMPIILSFSRTSFKAGKTLLSLARFSPGNMFSVRYRLSSRQKETDGNKYFILDVNVDGKNEGDEYALCEQWHTEFAMKTDKIIVHDEADATDNV